MIQKSDEIILTERVITQIRKKAGQADAYIVESLPKHASMFHQSPC